MSIIRKRGNERTVDNSQFLVKDLSALMKQNRINPKRIGTEGWSFVNGNGRTSGHAKDFERAFGVSKAQIPNYLNKVISQGEIVKNSLIKRGNRECFERIYYYEGKHYVVTGIGTNGFIVSAYPKKMKGDK